MGVKKAESHKRLPAFQMSPPLNVHDIICSKNQIGGDIYVGSVPALRWLASYWFWRFWWRARRFRSWAWTGVPGGRRLGTWMGWRLGLVVGRLQVEISSPRLIARPVTTRQDSNIIKYNHPFHLRNSGGLLFEVCGIYYNGHPQQPPGLPEVFFLNSVLRRKAKNRGIFLGFSSPKSMFPKGRDMCLDATSLFVLNQEEQEQDYDDDNYDESATPATTTSTKSTKSHFRTSLTLTIIHYIVRYGF